MQNYEKILPLGVSFCTMLAVIVCMALKRTQIVTTVAACAQLCSCCLTEHRTVGENCTTIQYTCTLQVHVFLVFLSQEYILKALFLHS